MPAIHLADQLDEASAGLGLTLVARLEEELGGPVAERRVQRSAFGEEPIAEIEKGACEVRVPAHPRGGRGNVRQGLRRHPGKPAV
jgi:hypothetical protein